MLRKEQTPKPCQPVKWNAPLSCRYMINFNGAVFRDQGEAGLGVVIRDVNGLPMAALVQKLKYTH